MTISTDAMVRLVERILSTYDLKLPPQDDMDWTGCGHLLISDCELVARDSSSGNWCFRAYMRFGALSMSDAFSSQIDLRENKEWRYGPPITVFSSRDFRKGMRTSQMAVLFDVQLKMDQENLEAHFTDSSTCTWWDSNVPQARSPMRVIDIFSGGFGGWAHTMEWVNTRVMGVTHVGALDMDEGMMAMHQRNHGGNMYHDPKDIPTQANSDDNVLLTHAMTLPAMQKLMEATQPDAWCMSPPCPPWSRSGSADGLFSEAGQCFVHALGVAKLLRPFVLMIENVSTITKHEHFELLKKTFEACGFRLIWTQNMGIVKLCPTKRNRWLAIAIDMFRMHGETQNVPLFTWPHMEPVNLGNSDCLLRQVPEQLRPDAYITDDMLAVYGNIAYAHSYPELSSNAIPETVLQARKMKPGDVTKTFMAAYGRQHDLPTSLLASQGLHTEILDLNSGIYRFFLPHEIAAIQAVFKSVTFPRNFRQAWKAVGNSISPVYGIIVFYMLAKSLGRPVMQVQELVGQMKQTKLRMTQMQVEIGDMWSVLSVIQEAGQVDLGVADIPSTVPFATDLRITIYTNQGVMQVLTSGDMTALELCVEAGIQVTGKTIWVEDDIHPMCVCDRHDMTIHVFDHGYMQVEQTEFGPQMVHTPIHAYHKSLKGIRAFMQAVQMDEHTETCDFTCKFQGVVFFAGRLPKMLQLAELVSFIHDPNALDKPLRVQAFGHPLELPAIAGDIARDNLIKFDFVRPQQLVLRLQGGGGQTKKQQEYQQALSNLAKVYVTQGLTVTQAQPQAKIAVQRLGTQTVLRACVGQSDQVAWKNLNVEADARAFVLMPPQDAMSKSAQKIQQIFRKKQAQKIVVPAAKTLQLLEGWFFNEDDTPAKIVGTMAPGSSGVTLTDRETISEYLANDVSISADELAVVVPWRPGLTTPRGTIEHVPVKDNHGSPAIICALVIQLGEKKMRFGDGMSKDLEVEPITNVAFTMHKSDFCEASWKQLVSAPVKFAFSMFGESCIRDSVTRVWGWLFMLERTKTTPENATFVTFHAAIRDSGLDTLLHASGVNKIYMRPKQDNAANDDRYAVIWTQDRVSANSALARLAGHKGLVYNGKTFGVRVAAADAQAAHKTVNPDKQTPQLVHIKHTYRLSPTPKGVTMEALTEWGKENKWNLRPMKRLNDITWLVGSDVKCPQAICSMGGKPVLLEEIKANNKAPSQKAVIAGTSADQAGSASTSGADPWPLGDPWAGFRPTTGASPIVAAPTARVVPGPVQASLDDQTAKLDRFEKDLASMKAQQDSLAQRVSEQGATTDHKIQTLENSVKNNFLDFSKMMQKQLADMTQAQDTQMKQHFDDMKQMFKERTKRKQQSTPQKEMEESDKNL
eukprot:Skav206899  [mRNA]  locus=scaffold2387:325761:329858:+ [translate_table: standard]